MITELTQDGGTCKIFHQKGSCRNDILREPWINQYLIIRCNLATQHFIGIIAFILAFLIAGCTNNQVPPTTAPQGSCSLELAQPTGDEAKIEAVLQSEGEFVVKQQIDSLMLLWAEDGSVVDAQHTPTSEADDQFWRGKDAIRHRYVRIVFPGAPTSITPSDLQIQLDGDKATVIASTNIDTENSKAGDRWQLIRQNECWFIQNLTYNLESNP